MGGRRMVIAMKKVYDRHAALGNFTGVDASITKAIADANDALAQNPDSREKHRALQTIAKLTHVAIPARFLEHPLSSWRESDQQLAETL